MFWLGIKRGLTRINLLEEEKGPTPFVESDEEQDWAYGESPCPSQGWESFYESGPFSGSDVLFAGGQDSRSGSRGEHDEQSY